MNKSLKSLLYVLLFLYVLSPVDACPGIIDDVIVVFVALNALDE